MNGKSVLIPEDWRELRGELHAPWVAPEAGAADDAEQNLGGAPEIYERVFQAVQKG